jgi:hypothetical protein
VICTVPAPVVADLEPAMGPISIGPPPVDASIVPLPWRTRISPPPVVDLGAVRDLVQVDIAARPADTYRPAVCRS